MSTLAGGNFSLLVTLSVCLFPLFLSVCVCVFWSLLLRDKLLSINYRQSVALLVTTPGSAIASLHISTPFITMMVVPVLVVVVAGRPGGMPDVYPCSRIPRFLCGSSTTRACVCVLHALYRIYCSLFFNFLNCQDFRAFGISLWFSNRG